MDDVDSVQAEIARNMLYSGDWITATLDGVKYLEKAPAWYWMIAACFKLFGVHDWAARIPLWISTTLLCWLTYRIARWATSREAGLYAGIVIATSIGLFLFTRILIPDVCLTLCIALALWSFLRATEPDELRPRLWAAVFAVGVAIGILLKGLIAGVFPVGIAVTYLALTGKWRDPAVWKGLHLWSGVCIALAVAAPWHVLATLQNPPYFSATLHSGPGEYKGFAWFYFVNEHLLRFLNQRYPRDYNTVPRVWFWLLHLVWFFPWSVFLPATLRLEYGVANRASRLRLLASIWIAFVLVFFTFSTTQEYYSMPCYPAVALLIGMVMGDRSVNHKYMLRTAAVVSGLCCMLLLALLIASWSLPVSGDITRALAHHSAATYTLSLAHMGDLTIAAFAYLRAPLTMAAAAFAVGCFGTTALSVRRAYLSLVLMMLLLFHAARLAMIQFDPYLSSRSLARALLAAPSGKVIFDDQFYTFSSVAFYTGKRELLLNGKVNNLEYGSNAPEAPAVFIDNADLQRLWTSQDRYYLLAEAPALSRLSAVVGHNRLRVKAESGGKYLLTNLP